MGDGIGNLTFVTTGSHFGDVLEVQAETHLAKATLTDEGVLQEVQARYPNVDWSLATVTRAEDRIIVDRSLEDPQLSFSTPRQSSGLEAESGGQSRRIPFDVFTHHNQALDVMSVAIDSGKVKKGGVHLHFDSHIDMLSGMYGREGIGNYIDALVRDSTVSEVYWIMPRWAKRAMPNAANDDWSGTRYVRPADFTVVTDGNEIWPHDNELEKIKGGRGIKVHIVIADDLPAFDRSQILYVDCDADYFSLIGSSVSNNVNTSVVQLERSLREFNADLSIHGINAAIVMLARSPKFTPREDIGPIEEYFKKSFGPAELLPDDSPLYKHGHEREYEMGLLYGMASVVSGRKVDCDGQIEDDLLELKSRDYGYIVELWQEYQATKDVSSRNKLLKAIDKAIWHAAGAEGDKRPVLKWL